MAGGRAWWNKYQVKTHTQAVILFLPPPPPRSEAQRWPIVIKDQGDCHLLKETTFVYFFRNWWEYMGEMSSLTMQTIVGICLTDGLLMRTLKSSVLNEYFLVYMWQSHADIVPCKAITIWLAAGPCFPRRHRSWYWNSNTVLPPTSCSQWTCVRRILLNVNHLINNEHQWKA